MPYEQVYEQVLFGMGGGLDNNLSHPESASFQHPKTVLMLAATLKNLGVFTCCFRPGTDLRTEHSHLPFMFDGMPLIPE